MAVDMKRMGSPIGARMIIDGREVDYYCGTSYYALHGDPRVIRAAADALREYGLGPATKMRVAPIDEVTDLACGFFEAETVTYLISGYLGAMALAQALSEDYDIIFVDDRSHYSVFDGIRSSGKRIVPFRHLDADDLSRRLARDVAPKQIPLVMTDGVFPVTGAIAPLPDYADALSAYDGGLLCTDDSHAVGVIGPRGQGTFEYHGLHGARFHLAGTLSKAFGGIGGIIPGDRALAEKIKRLVRVPMGASPPPIPAAAAAAMGIRILNDHPEMRQRLWGNVKRVRDGFRELGFEMPESPVPIVNVKGPPAVDLKHVEQELMRHDIVILHVPPNGYSDAPDVESLRIAVFSTHTDDQIRRLLDTARRIV
jgi:8-amino-7-oxononanoate synthase